MIKLLMPLLVAIHGLIHLIGASEKFAKEQAGKVGIVRVVWAIVAIVFVLLAYIMLVASYWWYLGFSVVLFSQALIIMWWQKAKWGTILNVIVLSASVINFSAWHFDREARNDATRMLLRANTQSKSVSLADLQQVPPVVRKWLVRSGMVGKSVINTVRLLQTGNLRTKPDAAWMPMTAEQYFTVDEPAFIWLANIDAGLFHIGGNDQYIHTNGHMEIYAAHIIPVASSAGPETDQGTRLRYLAEIQWFPTAALSPQISWAQTGPLTADAEMNCNGTYVKGTFTFNEAGDIVSFEANRYMELSGKYSLQKWYVPVEAYSIFEGIRVPSKGRAIWQLSSGDFNWFNWEIKEINYNRQSVYLPAQR